MNANSRWQDMVSENLAASGVPGYRRQELTLAATQAGLMPSSNFGSKDLPQSFSVPKASTSTCFQPGDVLFTGVKTDTAIDGKGFFQVQFPDGNTAYTRDGEFQVNSKGDLVTKEGYAVLGQSGPIQLDPHATQSISISAAGDITQGGSSKGKLAMTDFAKPELLTQISGAYFEAKDSKAGGQASNSTVRQGYLESSNTSTVREMANMITSMRGFEANQHVIQIQDDRMGKTISELGNPT